MEQNVTALLIEEQYKFLHKAKIEGDKVTINAIWQKLNVEKTPHVYEKLWNI